MGKFNTKVSIVTGAARGLRRAPREAARRVRGFAQEYSCFA